MDPKHDSFDGSKTVLREEGHDSDPAAADPEDKATELWAPAAPNLFASGIRPRLETERERAARLRAGGSSAPDTLVERAPQAEEDEELDDEHPIAAADAAHAVRNDTEPGYASATDGETTSRIPRVVAEELEASESEPSGPELDPGSDPLLDTDPESEAGPEPEEQDTEIVSGEFASRDALEMAGHLDDHAAREAEAERLLRDSVEVSGEEGEAALRLAAEARLRGHELDPSLTMVVDAPKKLPRLSHECRVCGRRIASPTPIRFRGPIHSERGFRCEACSNVVCAAHAVRVSGFFSTLFVGGRFRCVLCSSDALPPSGGKPED